VGRHGAPGSSDVCLELVGGPYVGLGTGGSQSNVQYEIRQWRAAAEMRVEDVIPRVSVLERWARFHFLPNKSHAHSDRGTHTDPSLLLA
jgi:hypothetical protein